MSIRLNKQETRSLITYGLSGLAVALLYGAGNVFFRQCTDMTPLDPPTEALQSNRELLNLFAQLQDLRDTNRVAFSRAVISADRLVIQHNLVREGKIHLSTIDTATAFSEWKSAIKYIGQMSRAAMKNGRPREAAIVDNICRKIYPCLQDVYMAILRNALRDTIK